MLLLTIEKLIYGGDGLARLPADANGRRKAVFLPFVLTGEKVKAVLLEEKPGFARARCEGVVESSPHRVQPSCPYFGTCGGCHYQHMDYEHQLESKKEILRENLQRIARLELKCEIEVHASPPWSYRNRARFQVQAKPAFAAGYFKLASHDLLAVETCPISSPLINLGLAKLWESGRNGRVPAGVREVEFFANAEDSELLAEVYCSAEAKRSALRAWADELLVAMPELAGIACFREQQTPGKRMEPLLSAGENSLTYRTEAATYRVSAGSFFQTNRFMTDRLVRLVTQGLSGERALDLYAGVGLFSTVLARDFNHVLSVEVSQTSTADLSYNLPSNAEVVHASTNDYLSNSQGKGRSGKGKALTNTLHQPNLAVVDPPRSGLGESVTRSLAGLNASRVTYVSCDPATLARDLVPLLAAGYRVEEAHVVDLFPQTYHVESVIQLVKQG